MNLCRVMSHRLTDDADLAALETLVIAGNPAPYAGRVHVPDAGLDVLSASPEAFAQAFRDDATMLAKVVKDAGILPE